MPVVAVLLAIGVFILMSLAIAAIVAVAVFSAVFAAVFATVFAVTAGVGLALKLANGSDSRLGGLELQSPIRRRRPELPRGRER